MYFVVVFSYMYVIEGIKYVSATFYINKIEIQWFSSFVLVRHLTPYLFIIASSNRNSKSLFV